MTAIKDNVSGGITEITHLVQGDGVEHKSQTCYYVSGSIDNPIASMTAKCTSTEAGRPYQRR
jgi:hypothetical protein